MVLYAYTIDKKTKTLTSENKLAHKNIELYN